MTRVSGPPIAVVYGEGFNCNRETVTGIRQAGGNPTQVHVNELGGVHLVRDFGGLVLPGGFSKGDAVRAGIVVARQIEATAGSPLRRFVELGRPVLGICNGFQILVTLGLLPQGRVGSAQQASLTANSSGRFECRWTNVAVNHEAVSPVASVVRGSVVQLPVAHGEGRFRSDPDTLARLRANGQILLQYCDDIGQPTQAYPANPNDADMAIAAITSEAGNVIGSMPHFERYTSLRQHPEYRRPDFSHGEPHGLPFLQGFVQMAA